MARSFAIIFFLTLSLLPIQSRAAGPVDPYARVQVPVCKTSIYIGNVTMKMGTFMRVGDHFETSYEATVFPFFFYSEKGKLRIDVGAAELEKLNKGESILIRGTATSSKGELRKVEGNATPESPSSGKIKIKVYVTKSIKLAFPTTYSFPDLPTTTTSPSSK